MTEEILEDLKSRLRPHNRKEIAAKTGVSFVTINHIMSGYQKNPRLSTLMALTRYADEMENGESK